MKIYHACFLAACIYSSPHMHPEIAMVLAAAALGIALVTVFLE